MKADQENKTHGETKGMIGISKFKEEFSRKKLRKEEEKEEEREKKDKEEKEKMLLI